MLTQHILHISSYLHSLSFLLIPSDAQCTAPCKCLEHLESTETTSVTLRRTAARCVHFSQSLGFKNQIKEAGRESVHCNHCLAPSPRPLSLYNPQHRSLSTETVGTSCGFLSAWVVGREPIAVPGPGELEGGAGFTEPCAPLLESCSG